jgi:hypothetical protein
MKSEIALPFTTELPAALLKFAQTQGLQCEEHPLASRPQDRHWHLRKPKQPGTIEITWQPVEQRTLLIVRTNRRGKWSDEEIQALSDTLKAES